MAVAGEVKSLTSDVQSAMMTYGVPLIGAFGGWTIGGSLIWGTVGVRLGRIAEDVLSGEGAIIGELSVYQETALFLGLALVLIGIGMPHGSMVRNFLRWFLVGAGVQLIAVRAFNWVGGE